MHHSTKHIATALGMPCTLGAPQTLHSSPKQISCGKLVSLSGVWWYRVLHYIHHKYNKEHTLSPFAGLAFHPLDGILQVCIHSFVHLFVRAFVCPSVRPSGRPSIRPSVHPSSHPVIHPSIHSFIHPSIHPSIHPFIHSIIHPFIHVSIYLLIHTALGSFILPFNHADMVSFIEHLSSPRVRYAES